MASYPYQRSSICTPLTELLRACTEEQRDEIAYKAGTTVNYLYSLAGCHRQKIGVALALAIEDASRDLNERTDGNTPIVTARDLSSMCLLAQIPKLD